MGVFSRISTIFRPRPTRRSTRPRTPPTCSTSPTRSRWRTSPRCAGRLADVATARKRLELQATQLQAQAQKLQDQAKQALAQGQEDLAREALARRADARRPARRASGPSTTGRGPAAAARDHRQPAPGPGRRLPDQEGDPEGELHRVQGPSQHRRGRLGHLGVDDRRRYDPRPGPGQDRPDAGAGGCHRRAPRHRRPERPRGAP